MNRLTGIISIFLLCNFCYSFTSKNLKVKIKDGNIVGRYMTSISGKTIRAFLSIPYAAPPIEILRFKPPKRPEPWGQKTLYAHNEPPMCTQTNIFKLNDRSVVGQEDCLYLNVYTPDINTTHTSKKLPVMVWLHGGGWMIGHSGFSLYGPQYLLEHDVILVTGNYRLGPLGFLSTEDENISGNFGLKDQQMILEWVQANIAKFGGDENSVTIFGDSAGGASVNYHMFSPKSRGLFHRAISQSGSVMNAWAVPNLPGQAKMRAIRLADKLDCPITGSSIKEMAECLRSVPADVITAGVYEFLEWEMHPMVTFGPVIEDPKQEEEPFITDFRYKSFSLDIPWMIGTTSEECLFTVGILDNRKRMKDLSDKWETILPLALFYDHLSEEQISEMNAAIKDYYFGGGFLMEKSNLTKLFSDAWMNTGFIENLQRRLEDNMRDNTYVYLFSHKGTLSHTELVGGNKEVFYGTSHEDDLLYLFPIRQTNPTFYNSIPTKEDVKLRKLMTKLWVNFATAGTPTPEWSQKSKFPFWSPASKFPIDYMRIGNENGKSDKLVEMKRDHLFKEESKFWNNLREHYGLKVWMSDVIKNKKNEEL